LGIGKTRDIDLYIADWRARDEGDAVIGFLPGKSDLKTGSFNLGLRKVDVFELGFLQAERGDVFVGGEPFEHLRQTYFQTVDVPGGDFHICSSR